MSIAAMMDNGEYLRAAHALNAENTILRQAINGLLAAAAESAKQHSCRDDLGHAQMMVDHIWQARRVLEATP